MRNLLLLSFLLIGISTSNASLQTTQRTQDINKMETLLEQFRVNLPEHIVSEEPAFSIVPFEHPKPQITQKITQAQPANKKEVKQTTPPQFNPHMSEEEQYAEIDAFFSNEDNLRTMLDSLSELDDVDFSDDDFDDDPAFFDTSHS